MPAAAHGGRPSADRHLSRWPASRVSPPAENHLSPCRARARTGLIKSAGCAASCAARHRPESPHFTSHSAGGGPPGQAGHAAGHRSGAALSGDCLASDCSPVLHPSHPRLVVPSIPSQSHIALSSLGASQSHIALSSPGPVTQCRLFACPVGRSVRTAAGGGPAGGAELRPRAALPLAGRGARQQRGIQLGGSSGRGVSTDRPAGRAAGRRQLIREPRAGGRRYLAVCGAARTDPRPRAPPLSVARRSAGCSPAYRETPPSRHRL